MMSSAVFLLLLLTTRLQSNTGELRVLVHDSTGLPMTAVVAIVNDVAHVNERMTAGVNGTAVVRHLPFGTYHLMVTHEGFAPFSALVDVRSAVPQEYRVSLQPAGLHSDVTVGGTDEGAAARADTSAVRRVDAASLAARPASLPGRGIADAISMQPGWLLEANAVLHPRGSEYQTQFVVDGLPLTDNRSVVFAPPLEAENVHSMTILTGGYPAEYGRKLGGVIEVLTDVPSRAGLHGAAALRAGSFATRSADAGLDYGFEGGALGADTSAAITDRYLDPPSEQNFTNHGRTFDAGVHGERDFREADRLTAAARYASARFDVPDEVDQQRAGQQQTRDSREAVARLAYQRLLGTQAVVETEGQLRRLTAGLTSNAASTPIAAAQARGIDDAYLKGTVAWQAGAHEWKAGGDAYVGTIHEAFDYAVTDPSAFDPETPRTFAFASRAPDREQSLFVQDRITSGPWTLNAGLRWDHYALLVHEHAFSPRLAVAWSPRNSAVVIRAAYDRVFETPAVENLLLASAPAAELLSAAVVRMPVRPSRGHFYQAGVSTALPWRWRFDATGYLRRSDNFADDDLLLNTGVSFPIAFARARVAGLEAELERPLAGSVSTTIAYSLMHGTADLPVTGGLLLGDDVDEAAAARKTFPVSQDQRHTIAARVFWQVAPRLWISGSTLYGSGLPFEFTGGYDEALAEYGSRIIDRVNFETGRVRPFLSADLSAALQVLGHGSHRATVQADIRNLTGRLNVINFAGLFSGTALAPPRSASLRLRVQF